MSVSRAREVGYLPPWFCRARPLADLETVLAADKLADLKLRLEKLPAGSVVEGDEQKEPEPVTVADVQRVVGATLPRSSPSTGSPTAARTSSTPPCSTC